ncbi:hypothetical protein DU35_07740 [Methanosarcina mazei]|uniref:Uncharacterized protein n=1 Tax=Methanosarcina mazei TaxID=2209 RepID=A0A0F8G9J1_METMZ|nr:hypothetical protein [Methanosarcina mazei]KKG35813.1 hypothetical protein DU35_07740 [Methanosarcina mazei]
MVKERIGDFVKFQKTEVINRPETIFGRKEKSDKKFSDSSGNSVNQIAGGHPTLKDGVCLSLIHI